MKDLDLGVSTWTFNGLLPADLRSVADGGSEFREDQAESIHAYFVELATAILFSEIMSVQLWYSPVFNDEVVSEQLHRLASAHHITSMHTPFGPHLDISSIDENIRSAGVNACITAADLLSKLGGTDLIVHPSSPVNDPSEMQNRIKASVRSMTEIADHCAKIELRTSMELLPGPAFLGNTAAGLLSMIEQINRPNVGVWLDVNHVFPADQLSPTVHALGPHIFGLHIADYDGVTDTHQLPTQGIIDWKQLITDLKAVNYKSPFTYEVRFEAADLDEAVFVLEDNYRILMSEK